MATASEPAHLVAALFSQHTALVGNSKGGQSTPEIIDRFSRPLFVIVAPEALKGKTPAQLNKAISDSRALYLKTGTTPKWVGDQVAAAMKEG